jgi:NADPH:quinone reductase-like Zn-dependent oxidoreductase
MKASGLNPVDWKLCNRKVPRSMGIDGCGLVYSIGDSVDK